MITFIATILVMGLLGVFMVYSISNMKSNVDEQIGKDIESLVSVYDNILEEKSNELKNLEAEILEKKQEYENIYVENENDFTSNTSYGNGSTILEDKATYIDETFYDNYNMVKNEFVEISKAATIKTARILEKVRKDVNVYEYKSLLKTFDFNIQYELNTLGSKYQQEIVESLGKNSMGKRRIIQNYIKNNEEFKIKEFMEFVRNYIYLNDGGITIVSNTGRPFENEYIRSVIYEKDISIGEGYIVKFRDEIYDFSL